MNPQDHPDAAAASGNPVCPLCGSRQLHKVGPILHARPTCVAGVPIDLPSSHYELLDCKDCRFRFKYPPIPQSLLMDCYAKSDKGTWELTPDPHERRFDDMKQMIERHAPGKRILDIGCFNGGLLQEFGSSWDRSGVEPSADAAELARQRGVSIIGASLDQLPATIERFDAATAIDVAEHVPMPMPFFRQIHDILRPGGVALIVTADYRAPSWRIEGSRYWYCSLAEHVSFYTRQTMEFISQAVGFDIVEYRILCHTRRTAGWRLRERTNNLIYLAGHSVRGFGVPMLKKLFVERQAPMWLSASDHMFAVLRKRKS